MESTIPSPIVIFLWLASECKHSAWGLYLSFWLAEFRVFRVGSQTTPKPDEGLEWKVFKDRDTEPLGSCIPLTIYMIKCSRQMVSFPSDKNVILQSPREPGCACWHLSWSVLSLPPKHISAYIMTCPPPKQSEGNSKLAIKGQALDSHKVHQNPLESGQTQAFECLSTMVFSSGKIPVWHQWLGCSYWKDTKRKRTIQIVI